MSPDVAIFAETRRLLLRLPSTNVSATQNTPDTNDTIKLALRGRFSRLYQVDIAKKGKKLAKMMPIQGCLGLSHFEKKSAWQKQGTYSVRNPAIIR